jgi:hypothetical protein
VIAVARGWESKSIESQQADAETAQTSAPRLSPEAAAAEAERRELELAKARVLADLERARQPAYREMLEQALQDLERRLRGLD